MSIELIEITDFDQNLDSARNAYASARDMVIERVIPLEEELELSEPDRIGYEPLPDFNSFVHDLTERIAFCTKLQALHRFAKLDRSQRALLIAGNKVHRVVGTKKYTIRSIDTPESIEKNTGVTWSKIMQYNNISPFELEPGKEVIIPYNRDEITIQRIFSNNPVYDAHIGARALGVDISCEPEIDETSGDISLLGNPQTFAQGLTILLSVSPGEVPGFDNYGVDTVIGEDYPPEVVERMLERRVKQALSEEPRIEEIRSITINRVPLGFMADIVVLPINNPEDEEFTEMVGG